jgi:hypothetical protein
MANYIPTNYLSFETRERETDYLASSRSATVYLALDKSSSFIQTSIPQRLLKLPII